MISWGCAPAPTCCTSRAPCDRASALGASFLGSVMHTCTCRVMTTHRIISSGTKRANFHHEMIMRSARPPRPLIQGLLRVALLVCSLAPIGARAAQQDEIQVYTLDINKPREFGLELHLNATPSGRTTPDYPGEITNDHGFRFTPQVTDGWVVSFTEDVADALGDQ